MCSYLTLDIHFPERGACGRVKRITDFSGQQTHPILSFFEESLTTVFAQEPGALLVGLEAEFFGYET